MFPRRLASIFLLMGAFCAAPAAASAPVIGTTEFDQLVQVATSHWPAPPCGGEIEYGYADLPGTTIGYATWLQPAGADPDPATFHACRIDIEAGLEADAATLCTVLAHELGHLRGLNHNDDPGDVMYANLQGALPECAAAFPAPEEVVEEAATVLPPAAAPSKSHRAKRARGKRARALRRAAHRARAGAAG